jgi:hypothetical protein
MSELPTPADFAAPPTPAELERWAEADLAARPHRLARLRARFEAAGIDAYFGIRREHMRYLTGFILEDGEEKVAGTSGHFLISGTEVVVQADSRYDIQARRQATGARIADAPRNLATWRTAGRRCARPSAPDGSGSRPRSFRTRSGGASRPRRRTWTSCRSKAGSRPIGR